MQPAFHSWYCQRDEQLPCRHEKPQGGAKRGWAVKEKGRHCKTLLLEQIFSSTDAHAEA